MSKKLSLNIIRFRYANDTINKSYIRNFRTSMIFDILVIVFFTSIIQSIFGTGVLLFGTPLMLISGYDFFTSLAILFPTSMLISLLQLINNINYIDKSVLKKIFLYSVPSIVAFLLLTNFLRSAF